MIEKLDNAELYAILFALERDMESRPKLSINYDIARRHALRVVRQTLEARKLAYERKNPVAVNDH